MDIRQEMELEGMGERAYDVRSIKWYRGVDILRLGDVFHARPGDFHAVIITAGGRQDRACQILALSQQAEIGPKRRIECRAGGGRASALVVLTAAVGSCWILRVAETCGRSRDGLQDGHVLLDGVEGSCAMARRRLGRSAQSGRLTDQTKQTEEH